MRVLAEWDCLTAVPDPGDFAWFGKLRWSTLRVGTCVQSDARTTYSLVVLTPVITLAIVSRHFPSC